MPSIGNTAANRFVAPEATTRLSGNGSATAFTLEHSVGSDEDILVSVDGVIQEPSVAYAVSNGTTLTFTAAPSNGTNNIFVCYLFRTVGTVSHPSNNALTATSGTFTGAFTSLGIDDNADATAITIDSSENVGIGETSSLGKLHVKSGDSGASSVSGNANELVVESADYTGITILGENEASIMFGDNEDPDVGRIVYFHGTNTMSFMTNANNAMHIDSTGAVTKPKQPAFSVHKDGTNVTNLSVGDHTLTWSAERFDQNDDFDLTNNRFVAPVTGKYFLQIHVRFMEIDVTATSYFLSLNTSNKDYNFIIDPRFGDADPSFYSIGFSVLADMDASDTVNIIFSQGGGDAQTDIDGRNNYTWFSGHLVC
jgi:hypothetical protein